MKKILYILISLATLNSCEKIAEAYLGFPMQAKNINAEFEDGLNVFGVFKSGPNFDTLTNIFEVHRMVEIHDTSFLLNNAEITITRTFPEPVLEFVADTFENGEYYHPDINPQPGDKYSYSCTADGFTVFAETTIPNNPEILSESVVRNGTDLSFLIKEDSTAFMYDIYALGTNNGNFLRLFASQEGNTLVEIDSKTTGEIQLYVFAYDKNFELYNSTSNTFFKPNGFRPSFSTVEGGFGCVYSVCSELFVIP